MKTGHRSTRPVDVLPGLVLAVCPPTAHAHLVSTGLGPVYDGILHFAVTLEDLVPTLALALLAGLRGTNQSRIVIFVLPLAWLVAGGAAVIVGRSAVLPLGWLPFVLLGGLVAADARLPRNVTTALSVLLGVFLGYANGAAMGGGGPGLRGVLGVAVAVFVLTTLVTATVVSFQEGWLRIVWRVLGSWIAASGLLLLGWSLAR